MTELEGLPFDVNDPEVDARKLHAVIGCKKLESIDVTDRAGKESAIRELFGSVGANPNVLPGFRCDNGRNIHVGDEFLANYIFGVNSLQSMWVSDIVRRNAL